jgi:hypothetical protein
VVMYPSPLLDACQHVHTALATARRFGLFTHKSSQGSAIINTVLWQRVKGIATEKSRFSSVRYCTARDPGR